MKSSKNLPVQFLDRIHGTAVDYGIVFAFLFASIFMQEKLEYELIGLFLLWYLLNVVPSYFSSGLTLGKLHNKTVIVNDDYSNVSALKMNMRAFFILLMICITSGLYAPIALILLNNRIDKKSFHDMIFKTRVIYKNPYLK